MTVINTNVGALQARTYAVRADSNVTRAMERLSSGLRINSAADDAAGLAVANKMESQIRGMNMAIRNSQDGISLVQTAESAMGEINNMVIRMRELAVQMNNGVYTNADRSNAQLEVTALLQEIDKVATNSAFNQVKILDGTYSQDIRAGNTNPEVINVTIDRMNTDTLGGGRVTTGDVDATSVSKTFKASNTNITATEGRVTIAKAQLGSSIQAFETANAGGVWSIDTSASDDNAKFEINASTGAITLNSSTPVAELDFDNPVDTGADNVYSFKVQYTQGGTTVTDNITLNITDKPVATSGPVSGAAALTVEEGDCIKIYSIDTTDNGTARSGIFSDQFQEFVAANAGSVVFSKSAGTVSDDSGDVTLNTATGVILANLDFERPTDSDTDNVYNFTITATAGGVAVSEEVTLTVTDAHAAQVTLGNGVAHTANGSDAGADGAALEETSTAYGAADTVALDGTITWDANIGNGGNVALTWANIDSMIANGGGSDGLAAFIADHGAANVTATLVDAAGSGAAVTGGNGANKNGITLLENTAAGTYEDIKFTLTAGNDTFHLEFDLVQVDAGGASDNAAAVVAQNANQMTRQGEHHQLDVRAGGEAMTIDLKNSNAAPTAAADRDQHFDGIGTAYQADPCGTFEIVAGTLAFNDDTAHANRTNLSVSADGVLTLAAGAAQGTYNALVKYTNNDGEAYFERIDINSVDIGEASGVDIATATALTASVGTQTASEDIAGTSVLAMAEARQGNIASTGTNSVLSTAFNTFVGSYTGGTYAVSGADASAFSINSSTGALETKGLVDFETKTSYAITVTYTSGANSYSEDITVNVTDNAVDNTSHIANVDLSTQAGAATGVTILDKAIDQISESQAKLGAIQNRLQYNIDNLSKASMLTTTAKGRIMDADFAAETSELSKQQILSQAATSMLAQANQSKQSVLALLQ